MICQVCKLVLPTADVLFSILFSFEARFLELECCAAVRARDQGPFHDGGVHLVERLVRLAGPTPHESRFRLEGLDADGGPAIGIPAEPSFGSETGLELGRIAEPAGDLAGIGEAPPYLGGRDPRAPRCVRVLRSCLILQMKLQSRQVLVPYASVGLEPVFDSL